MKKLGCKIIAEAGVNHNGDIEKAFKLVEIASSSKADFIKFQLFQSKNLVTPNALKANYQINDDEKNQSQLEMLKKLEFSFQDMQKIQEFCQQKKIGFICSAFDLNSLDFINSLNVSILKIPSGEINNLPYLRKIGSFNKKIYLSTGISYLSEIKDALKILTENGTRKSNICILHCSSEYPTPLEEVNLRAMKTIKDKLNVNVGYSDHSVGSTSAIGAIVLGASVIEKHFTLSKMLPGPDHKASLDPIELKKFIQSIRDIESAMGSAIKQPNSSEIKNKKAIRKSIVSSKKIKKGEVFTEKNITTKRPGKGLNPMLWDKIIGKKAKKDFYENDFIEI